MQLFMETTDVFGRVLPGLHETLSGDSPRELVEAMAYPSPFTEDLSLREYMCGVLRRVGVGAHLPRDPDEAAKAFLDRLRARGLVVISAKKN